MTFELGDQVKFLNEMGGGVVVAIEEDGHVHVEDEHGFILPFSPSELVSEKGSGLNKEEIKEKLRAYNLSHDESGLKQSNFMVDYHEIVKNCLLRSQKNWTSRNKNFVEIDLHLEHTTNQWNKMNDGQKLHHQLSYAKCCFDAAVDLRISQIVFIHGVGEGILKHDLRQWLKTMDFVHFEDGDFRQYGSGATYVKIYSLNK